MTDHPIALTIAGSDPSGGAGLQADLKAFHQHGVYGASVVTLLTVQNTQGVTRVETLDADLVTQQLDAVIQDLPPHAIKTGALGSAELISCIADTLADFDAPIVVDPVMTSKHGHALINEDAIRVVRDRLLPLAHLVTPNRFEAEELVAVKVNDRNSLEEAARKLQQLGAKNVLVKTLRQGDRSLDLLLTQGGEVVVLENRFLDTQNNHGSGCVLSASIAAQMARGEDLLTAIQIANRFVHEAIRTAAGVGKGTGPLNLHAAVKK